MNTRTLPLGRMSWMMVALAAIGVIALSAAVLVRPVHAAGEKWFVCKYVGTPGVDERLQTGNNPISVPSSAIGEPVVVHSFFNDAHGRSWVLAEDVDQEEPSVDECPLPENPPPPPNTVTVTTTVVPAGPIAIGASAHDTATIHNFTSDAAGTITYKLYSDSACATEIDDLTPALNTVASGIAPPSDSHTFTGAGTFYFWAEYSGDVFNTGPVNSTCSAEPFVVSPNIPTVTTTVVPAGPIAIGASAHDTATIHNFTSDAAGTITYKLYSDSACATEIDDLTPALNTVASGIAPVSDSHTFTGAGTFYFYAVYLGDPNNTGPVNSGCAAEPFVVNPAGENVVLRNTGTPAPSTEIVVLAGSGTPAPSVANTALSQNGVSPIPTIAFSLILLASLGALAYANVKTVRSRS